MKPYNEWTRIEKLQHLIRTLRELIEEDKTLDFRSMLYQAESKLHEAYKQAGWHCVSPIRNGSATESIFSGTLEACQEYVSIWLEAHPGDKGNLIISPL